MSYYKPKPIAAAVALGVSLTASLACVLSAQSAPAPKKKLSGAEIYAKQCASCHGQKGEGTAKHAKPLVGSQSEGQLAGFIAKTMPPGPKRTCVGPDAQAVAGYIFESFYSPLAQARNKPARIELSRLTVPQYRNAVTDLVGSFRPAAKLDERRGLRGEYYKTRPRRGDRILERVDPEVRFDFGTTGALPEQNDPYQFSMKWDGAVLAPETGEYEIILRCEHAVRLWVNDPRNPLIDAQVKSGSDNEYRASLTLLGGRYYPVQLEFSKGVQGVNDLKKLKEKPSAPATLTLEWKQPKRTAEVIPQRCLSPVSVPDSFVVTAPFPPDDRSLGYERGTSVSKEWEEATTEGAIETTSYVFGHLRELSGVPDEAPDRAAKLREFCKRFATRAFRRPLTPELEETYVNRQFQLAADPDTALKRSLLLTLKSPRFLYREAGSEQPDAYDLASRLSFGLWDSLPDETLLKAAAGGELSSRSQVVAQAERMIADPRARAKVREFFFQWLKVDQYPDLAKDAKRFPGFDPAVAADLRTSLELSLNEVIWSERSDFRELFTGSKVFLNGRLAKIYGVDLPADAPFQAVALEPAERSGILTHPYLLASFAYLDTSSPIHRGVLIARNLLGRTLQPPPEAFTPLPAEAHPNMTTRQRVSLQTKPGACAGCHDLINPLGFTLEKFDAIGRFRVKENAQTVDATGSYQPLVGKPVRFAGVRDLATYLAGSEEAQAAFVEKLFQHAIKQPVRAYGTETLPGLKQSFKAGEFSVRKQLVETMAVSVLGTPVKAQAGVAAAK